MNSAPAAADGQSAPETSVEELRRAVAYYAQRVDELGGANVQADAIISAIKSDLRVKNDGFDLLAELQESIDAQMPIGEMLTKTLEGINLRLRMDRSVFLTRAADGPGFVPHAGLGFDAPALERFPALVFDFASGLGSKGSYLLVNRATALTPLAEQVRAELGVPFFVALPVVIGRELTGVLLAGRYKEAKPFAPPVGQAEANILRAIAGFVAVSWANAHQFIILEQQVQQRTGELQRSLSELRTTQAQLVQKEKMASLGELMAGIAHEIQNPLNFVNNFADVSAELLAELRDERAKGAEANAQLETELLRDLTQNLAKITRHGQRASHIVRGMLEHSRTSSDERQPTNLNQLTDEYLRLAYHGLRAKNQAFNAELETDLAAALPPVEAVPGDLGRVLLNLFTNAFYAVQQRQLSEKAGYAPRVSVRTRQVEQQVEVQVRDNGTGMSAEVLAKVFQPFFTTKPPGEGTGLGLSLSYDIVTQGHGGTLQVASEPGQGSTFTLTLPMNDATQRAVKLPEA